MPLEDLSTSNSDPLVKAPLEIYDLGRIDYFKALELQRHYHRKVIEGSQGDLLLACSHNPVFTCGTSSLDEHIYVPQEELAQQGTPIIKVERGGSVTYHGPEQAILYPIINLHNHKTDVGWYMRALEEVVLLTLCEFGVTGVRVPGKTGVWIDEQTKIAFGGVRISRWCTLHGLSLNVIDCSQPFQAINPCGLGPIRITSIAELTNTTPTVQDVIAILIRHFLKVFNYES